MLPPHRRLGLLLLRCPEVIDQTTNYRNLTLGLGRRLAGHYIFGIPLHLSVARRHIE
jgi:hypothetical protein